MTLLSVSHSHFYRIPCLHSAFPPHLPSGFPLKGKESHAPVPALKAGFTVLPLGKFLKSYLAPGEFIGYRIKFPTRLITMMAKYF